MILNIIPNLFRTDICWDVLNEVEWETNVEFIIRFSPTKMNKLKPKEKIYYTKRKYLYGMMD